MRFFIDFENVHALGFRGVEFLTPEDEVVLFYSKVCMNLEKGILDKLFDTGCSFRIFKVENGGRNAMDFYITSHISEILGRNYKGHVGIVSHDKGFRAIRDYWLARNPEMKIVCKPDIGQCIVATNETGDARWQAVHQEYEPLNLEIGYDQFEKRNRLQALLEEILANSDREWHLEKLAKDLVHYQTGRETYLSLMRMYGVLDGLGIYQALKKVN